MKKPQTQSEYIDRMLKSKQTKIKTAEIEMETSSPGDMNEVALIETERRVYIGQPCTPTFQTFKTEFFA